MKKFKGYWLNYLSVGDVVSLKIGYLSEHGYWKKHEESDWLVKAMNDEEIVFSRVGFKFEGFRLNQKDIDDGFVIIGNKK